MANSDFQDPPQAQGYWTTNVSKMAVLFWKWMNGQVTPVVSSGGMSVPANDEQVFTYYGATNNVANIVYKQAGTQVAHQTFEYVGAGAADDDDVSRITLVIP